MEFVAIQDLITGLLNMVEPMKRYVGVKMDIYISMSPA
jgi:hypothetical protein